MAPLPEARIVRILFPQTLPMYEHIDIVPFDHNTLDRKIQRNGAKRLEIVLGLFPQPINLVTRYHERDQIRRIFLHIGLAERFYCPINTEVPLVIVGILNLFAATTGAG
jgi:hypothetical protein